MRIPYYSFVSFSYLKGQALGRQRKLSKTNFIIEERKLIEDEFAKRAERKMKINFQSVGRESRTLRCKLFLVAAKK